jgi:hypothetical protein
MRRSSKPTVEQRRYYEKLVGCVVVRVLWDKLDGQPLPVLIVSTPGGGTAECVVLKDQEANGPGYLRHDA